MAVAEACIIKSFRRGYISVSYTHLVGFVNSGIMELHQAIGIIMGSNVGTTVTSWLLSLSGLQGDSIWIQMLLSLIHI